MVLNIGPVELLRMGINEDNSKSNSIFIAPNLHLKTDSRHTKQKAENYNHKPETWQGSAPWRETRDSRSLCKDIDFELPSE